MTVRAAGKGEAKRSIRRECGDGDEQVARTTETPRPASTAPFAGQTENLFLHAAPRVGGRLRVLASICALFISMESERSNVYSIWKLAFLKPYCASYALAGATSNCCLVNFD